MSFNYKLYRFQGIDIVNINMSKSVSGLNEKIPIGTADIEVNKSNFASHQNVTNSSLWQF